MGTPTHVTDFDPQTDVDFAHIENDAALAERDANTRTLSGVSIYPYGSAGNEWMTIATYNLPDGSISAEILVKNATKADAVYAMLQEVTNA